MTEAIASVTTTTSTVPDEVREILSEGLSIADDCVLLRFCAQQNQHLAVSDFYDETAFEATVNKIHIDASSVAEAVTLGLASEQAMISLLEREADRPCRVVLSIDDPSQSLLDFDDPADAKDVLPSASLRFYARRDVDDWLSWPLDDYAQPVRVHDVTPRATTGGHWRLV